MSPSSTPDPLVESPRPAWDDAAFEAQIERDLPRNYAAHFAHGMLGMTGFRLVFAPTFVPAYLFALTQSTLVVGIGASLLYLGTMLSPIAGAARLERSTQVRPSAFVIGGLMCLQILLLALSGFFLRGAVQVFAALVLIFAIGFFTGAQRVAFQALFGKVIPLARRGRLQGWRNVCGGGLAAVTSYAAGRLLIGEGGGDDGYSMVFLLSFVLTALGLAALIVMREPHTPARAGPDTLLARIRRMPGMVRSDPNYQTFLLIQSLTMASRLAAPFYILFAGQAHGLDGKTVGLLSFAFLGADMIANAIWGQLGDRHGFRAPLIASLSLSVMATVVLLSSDDLAWLFVAFLGLGGASSGYLMSSLLIVLEFGPREDLPMRLAISTTVEGALATLSPLAGGALMLWAGYPAIFGISLVFAAAALAVTIFRFRDPRRLRI
ncbi:MFS transporter [Sphingomonas gilva]|uniref:MFS transporter n=1 Tax=Sphingomonas gilva TaxID=2305907 RepID=A0A396RRG0_9SPHN|nr:MFS transporter [Sphingomonas gilva]RHW19247.1 MFS transporter [Sphingomonas gilva]